MPTNKPITAITRINRGRLAIKFVCCTRKRTKPGQVCLETLCDACDLAERKAVQ